MNSDECHCICHSVPGTRHITACCNTCPTCGKNIIFSCWKEHQASHHQLEEITLSCGITLQTIAVDKEPALFVIYDGDVLLLDKECVVELADYLTSIKGRFGG